MQHNASSAPSSIPLSKKERPVHQIHFKSFTWATARRLLPTLLVLALLFSAAPQPISAAVSDIAIVAGTYGYSGDGGPTINAQLNFPHDVAVGGADNLFIAGTLNHNIRKMEVMATPSLSTTVNVPGTSDPWLAGMPNGSTASGGSVAPTNSPVLVPLAITGGGIYTFNATGSVHNGVPAWAGGPDGYGVIFSHSAGAENGIGNITVRINALIGVFLDDSQPNMTAAPSGLNFSTAGATDFLTLSPQLKQPFFIGDGLTSAGSVQQFVAPAGATRLFLGTMDAYGYANNSGSFTVKISASTPTAIELISFTATAADGGIQLRWETGTEINNAGFNVYRVDVQRSSQVRVNSALIAPQGSEVNGATYTFTDSPGPGVFHYVLEDVDFDGTLTHHGPVEVSVPGNPFIRVYIPTVSR